ncbi:hypothetical protein BDV93DRAFT_608443 [Ceratobasidium sp. AG-I]|nr:hypothetical protein BDV93DRAFT_608443 [Ceratobasidium sp. AG-I]
MPCRPSSGQRANAGSSKPSARPTISSGTSHHSASHTRSHVSNVVGPTATKQPEVEKQIDMEVDNAVFLDSNFVQNFLPGDPERLVQILYYCKSTSRFTGGWVIPQGGPESKLYGPIVEILNTIKRAIDNDNHPGSHDQPNNNNPTNGQPELASPRSVNHSASAIPADDSDSGAIKPDIVLFEGQHEHWETVGVAIEVKSDPKSLREEMRQLSRYARAMYAHQLHRRHLYGLVVCGPKVTFVRYDRAGFIHSPEIDMCESFEVFTKAFASLMMLDRTAAGYDPAFSTTVNQHTRLDYHVDLPGSAFEPSVAGPSRSSEPEGVARLGPGPGPRVLPTRRFKVIERLCHRKCIRGRATIVLRIREVVEPDELVDKGKEKGKDAAEGSKKKRKADEMDEQQRLDYILKLIWRDPLRESEGDVMEILRGMFALAQHVWHGDVPLDCVCGTGEACQTCVDETPRPPNLVRSPIRGHQNAALVEGCATKSTETTTAGLSGCVRKHRIYSRIVMSSIGEPLWTAHSVWEFLEALHDAILGYWRLVNLGILHRDISDGNVMLLRGTQTYQRREWMEEEERNEDVEALRKRFGDMAESESKLRHYMNKLNRDPKGMVSDFDLHTIHDHAHPLGPLHGSNNEAVFSDKPDCRSPPPGSDVLSKRRKTGNRSSVPITTSSDVKGKDKERQSAVPLEHKSRRTPTFDEDRPDVDFRTGTPTFMSSFFWLILWSVAAHLGPGENAQDDARAMLNSLEQFDLDAIAVFKTAMLTKSFVKNGQEMRDRLLSLGNDWIIEPVIPLIIRLGSFFFIEATAGNSSDCDPSVVFPQFVDMILVALSKRPSD